MTSETPYKIKLFISGGGSWQQNNEEWQFYTQLPVQHVIVPSNITYSRLVNYIENKYGMEPSIGVTRLSYNEYGKVYILWTNEDVTQFLQFASQLKPLPTLYGYDDISYVPETHEEEYEEEGTEDEEEDEEKDDDFDNYVFNIPDSDPDEARRRKYYVARSFPRNDDFHDMPPPLPSDEPFITPNQPIQYNRRGRVKLQQVCCRKP